MKGLPVSKDTPERLVEQFNSDIVCILAQLEECNDMLEN